MIEVSTGSVLKVLKNLRVYAEAYLGNEFDHIDEGDVVQSLEGALEDARDLEEALTRAVGSNPFGTQPVLLVWSDGSWERRDVVLRRSDVQDAESLFKALARCAEKAEAFNMHAGRELVYMLPVDEWVQEELRLEETE